MMPNAAMPNMEINQWKNNPKAIIITLTLKKNKKMREENEMTGSEHKHTQ